MLMGADQEEGLETQTSILPFQIQLKLSRYSAP